MLHLTVRVLMSNPIQAQQTVIAALTPLIHRPLRPLFKLGPHLLSCLARTACTSRRLLAIPRMIPAPTIRSRLRGYIRQGSIPSAHITRHLQSLVLMNPLQRGPFHQTRINQKHLLASHRQRMAMCMEQSVGAHIPQPRLYLVTVHMSLPMEHSHPRRHLSPRSQHMIQVLTAQPPTPIAHRGRSHLPTHGKCRLRIRHSQHMTQVHTILPLTPIALRGQSLPLLHGKHRNRLRRIRMRRRQLLRTCSQRHETDRLPTAQHSPVQLCSHRDLSRHHMRLPILTHMPRHTRACPTTRLRGDKMLWPCHKRILNMRHPHHYWAPMTRWAG